MVERLTYLIFIVLVVSLGGNVQAQTATWTDATEDHDWFTLDNWSEFPGLDHWAKIRNGAPGVTITQEGAVARRVHIGYDADSALTVDGGTLLIGSDDLLIGKNGGSATLNMISGTIDIERDLEVAGGDPGVLNMHGGTIIVGDDFEIPESDGSIADVNLYGGTIILDGSYDGGNEFRMYEGGSMNITGGTLIIDGNEVSDIQGFIENGWITPYPGHGGTLQLDYDDVNDTTTLKALSHLEPYPADAGLAEPGTIELSWTLPDPCVPGQSVPVDVYFTDNLQELKNFINPTSFRILSNQNATSKTMQIQANKQYYWAIDTYQGTDNDPVWGPIFSFFSGKLPPQVNAGDDIATWLDNDAAEVSVSASVEDSDPTTSVWILVSEPNDPNAPDAVIADPTALNTTITLSALGEYILQLEADNGDKMGLDTLTINVYNDQCSAAKS
ncbi:MAG: hypothetical protein HQ515_13990, partial [Phycisphaeraceae bacterium]|nr:hypothetical protein [Phycisphaeraceae bacterium]